MARRVPVSAIDAPAARIRGWRCLHRTRTNDPDRGIQHNNRSALAKGPFAPFARVAADLADAAGSIKRSTVQQASVYFVGELASVCQKLARATATALC